MRLAARRTRTPAPLLLPPDPTPHPIAAAASVSPSTDAAARVRPSAGLVLAVARCAACGLELGEVAVTGWERLSMPENPWAKLVALADLHKLGCRPVAVLPAEAAATERLRAIEAWAARCSRDSWGLMALGDAVRKLLPPGRRS